MIYNIKKMDDSIFTSSIQHVGREVVNYYTGETEKVIVEPNGSLDGGKIYYRNDSWIKRGDIIKVSGEWYVVNDASNLASDVYNVGVITRCDVELTLRLGDFVYNVPAVASKYSGNSNVRGIIDDSVDGQLSFITGYDNKFKLLTDNPCVTVFDKVWQIGNYLNVNKVLTVYCKGVEHTTFPELCIEPIPLVIKVGDTIDLNVHVLNKVTSGLPGDLKVTLSGNNMGVITGTSIQFTKVGACTITIQSKELGTYYTSPSIAIKA